tara:strand:+ start:384 stop:776 length:393 start_codon:yes stop_codon:yes gene_type:complete
VEDDTPISNNVVKGPWSRVKIITPQETDQITEDMAIIDEVAESIMIPTIHNLAENGVEIQDGEFISEIGFLNETIKSIMYRSMGYQHPLTDLVIALMKIEKASLVKTAAKFDYELVSKLIEKISEENDKT